MIKRHNFFNIYSKGMIQSVVERFWVGRLQYKQKAQKILKFQQSQGRQKNKVFPPKDLHGPKCYTKNLNYSIFYNKRNF